MPPSHLPLFGGVRYIQLPNLKRNPYSNSSRAWSPKEWTSSDDRVRGGSSTSTLSCSPSSLKATFHGNLDINTLGGAGFASQRTTGDNTWDLSLYDGLELVLGPSDGKTYTLTLKNEVLPKQPDGRDRSSVSWEFDFKGPKAGGKIFVPWNAFRATYRGRDVTGEKLDLKGIKRFGIMVRSFFGRQEGSFELGIFAIAAVRGYRDDPEEFGELGEEIDEKMRERRTGWFSWLGACLGCRS